MYLLYTLVVLLFVAVLSPYFVYQAIRYRKYVGSLGQRLGFLPVAINIDREPSIWIHAVSVGEVLTARALLGDLKSRYPGLRLFLSTTTMSGQQVARRDLPGVDGVFYFPFDLGFIVERTLRVVQPRLFVMMENEIWPNLLRACRRHGVRTIVVNGRMSARSYPRYRLVRPLFRRVLATVDRFCVQSDEIARRLIDLGADPARVSVTGSLKFDSLQPRAAGAQDQPADRVLRFFRVREGRPVIVAGSTLRGEEAAVFAAFRTLRAAMGDPLLIVAPRHPERFGEVERLARDEGFLTVRRTDLTIDAEPHAEVVVLDTIGELAQVYRVADVVFVGGSLVDAGGHNILEPAVFGKPIVFGPHMENFREIAETFLAAGAAVQITTGAELAATLGALLADPERRGRLGAAASAVVEANRGSRARTLAVIEDLLPPAEVSRQSGRRWPFQLVS